MFPEIKLGPPGTGKTTTLLEIVELELSRGVPPDRIGYFSFTRKAADEAILRAQKKFGLERSDLPHFRTLHSMCFRSLGLRSSDVLEGDRLREFASYAGITITGRGISEDGTMTGFDRGDRMMFMENLSRVTETPLSELHREDMDDLRYEEVELLARKLVAFKAQKGYMDYTDMLSEFVKSGIDLKLEVLIVDEFQDLSMLQFRVVEHLARNARRVVFAGDDDQAIYRWAGAAVENFVALRGNVSVLGQSYRVPLILQAISDEIIQTVRGRRPKAWSPRKGDAGSYDRANRFAEVDCDGPEILILARNTYLIREQIEPELRRQGIVYERHGHPSIKAGILLAVEAWERLRRGDTVSVAAAREIYKCLRTGSGVKRGHKKLPAFPDDQQEVSLMDLADKGGLLTTEIWHEALEDLPQDEMAYMLAARRRGEKFHAKPRVVVSTIHGAKGGEADHVIVLKEMAWRSFKEMDTPGGREDEARVWYVSATRAKRRLTIVESSTFRQCPWL